MKTESIFFAVLMAVNALGAALPEAAIVRDGLTNSRIVFETTGKGVVAFIGGSITEMKGYRPILIDSLKKRFPRTEFKFISAGVSSTCSDTGAFRAEEDVFSKGVPDLFFVEFAVNDDQDGHKTKAESIRALEGLVRHARRVNPKMDIMLSMLVNRHELELVQSGVVPEPYKAHLEVADHYGLPTANIGAELAARIAKGEFTWQRYRDCHPSPDGNRLVADVQERIFDASGFGAPFTGGTAKARPLPPPIDRNCYEEGRFLDFEEVKNEGGWEVSAPDVTALKVTARPQVRTVNFHAEKPGAKCSFSFVGTAAGLYITTGPDAGMLDVSVDGAPPRRVDLWDAYSPKLHYPKTVMLADGLPRARHTISLTLSEERNPASRGTACRIYRFAVNGEKDKE
jgi:hypothetical protein